MAEEFKLAVYRKRMDGALTSLRSEFGGLRTGRANAALLDGITVSAYGSEMPLNQVGSVSVPEPRMLLVNVWDKSMVGSVEKALRQSNLGINPVVDGQTLRIPMPPLTEERRRDLVKVAGGYAEQAKIAVRNVRRDGMDALKKAEKDGDMSEDEQKAHSSDVQKATDDLMNQIDAALEQKSAEIMQV
ncbi:ribosome recycling factor [Litorimonas sp. RW-G-Af-16]|uniref:ribosome recycling factor n=1 Tax=Litorimonas sp. RW-G-Af-16 TaxID=3241168 RepID=UPI00390C5B8B